MVKDNWQYIGFLVFKFNFNFSIFQNFNFSILQFFNFKVMKKQYTLFCSAIYPILVSNIPYIARQYTLYWFGSAL